MTTGEAPAPSEAMLDADGEEAPDTGSPAGGRPSWSVADWWLLAGLTIFAGVLRIQKVGVPRKIMFDELYYAKEACYYARASLTACRLDDVDLEVHPPLGKWLIAAGIELFGFDPFGWRFASVVAGTISVALLYLLARKLFRSTLPAVLSSGLLAIDLLHFVQSRIAMLDIFVPMFGLAALLFAVWDRERLFAWADRETRRRPGVRPWRIAAGAAGGAALASKWSGGLFLITVVVLTIAWEIAARRGRTRRVRRVLVDEGPSIFFALVFMPLVVYALTHLGRVEGAWLTWPWSEGSWFASFWDKQIESFDIHRELDAHHSYESPAWSWPLLKRPVAYWFDDSDNSHILATGAPFIWWTSLLALLYTAYRWLRTRDPRGPTGVIVAGFGFAYLPWLLLGFVTQRDAVFLFYMLPAVPFMCLAIGYMATQIGRSWEARAAIGLYAAAALALFAFYFPIVANRPLAERDWHRRLWIFDSQEGCEKPVNRITTTIVTETVDGSEVVRTDTSNAGDTLPPKGWCWI